MDIEAAFSASPDGIDLYAGLDWLRCQTCSGIWGQAFQKTGKGTLTFAWVLGETEDISEHA